MKSMLKITLIFWLCHPWNLPIQAQALEYAILDNNDLIIPYRTREDQDLKTYTLDNPKIPKIDRFLILLNSFYPFVWD